MHFCCIQPNIVEDVHAVRPDTKPSKSKPSESITVANSAAHTTTTITAKFSAHAYSSAGSAAVAPPRYSTRPPPSSRMGSENGMMGKTGLLNPASPSPTIDSTFVVDLDDGEISWVLPPPPVHHPIQNADRDDRAQREDGTVENAKREGKKNKSLDMGLSAVGVGLIPPTTTTNNSNSNNNIAAATTPANANVTITDSEREGVTTKQTRRKSREKSASLAALGHTIANIGKFAGAGSGRDTDATARRKRVSTVMIGNSEGFKHEGHVGMNGVGMGMNGAGRMNDAAGGGGEVGAKGRTGLGPKGLLSSSEVPNVWNVESWRAEIERTLSPTTTPRGPRPTTALTPLASAAEMTLSNVAGPTRANKMSAYATNDIAAYANNLGTGSARKPIPAQGRKLVLQPLPATAEVSPFPTLHVANETKDGEGKRVPSPFDVNVKREREVMADKGVEMDVGPDGDRDRGPPIPKVVPLLGVPGDEAYYVSKSKYVPFDDAVAEIANEFRDLHAEPPL